MKTLEIKMYHNSVPEHYNKPDGTRLHLFVLRDNVNGLDIHLSISMAQILELYEKGRVNGVKYE